MRKVCRAPSGALSVVLTLLLLVGGSAGATSIALGTDLTVNDGLSQANATGWYGDANNPDTRTDANGNRTREDNETEAPPSTYTGQVWDLEGVFYNDKTGVLSLVGGFNFLTGVVPGHAAPYYSGDIFLNVPGPVTQDATSGYDYVIHLDRAVDGSNSGSDAALTTVGNLYNYVVYKAPAGGFTTFAASAVLTSNPWLWQSGGSQVASGTFEQLGVSDVTDIDLNTYFLTGNNGPYPNGDASHNVLTGFDLSFLSAAEWDTGFTVHYTMSCGNDELDGLASKEQFEPPVPEPATLSILSMALLGLGLKARKHLKG